jgi:hypothetical protein
MHLPLGVSRNSTPAKNACQYFTENRTFMGQLLIQGQ